MKKEDRAWQEICRKQLCEHIQEKLAIVIAPRRVRLITGGSEPYYWDIEKGYEHLFKHQLSQADSERCRALIDGLGRRFNAAKVNSARPIVLETQSHEVRNPLRLLRSRTPHTIKTTIEQTGSATTGVKSPAQQLLIEPSPIEQSSNDPSSSEQASSERSSSKYWPSDQSTGEPLSAALSSTEQTSSPSEESPVKDRDQPVEPAVVHGTPGAYAQGRLPHVNKEVVERQRRVMRRIVRERILNDVRRLRELEPQLESGNVTFPYLDK